MFIVHQSNRTEELIDALASVLAEPLPDPLQAEVIAVQSLGMRTWLSQQLAGRLGIWANGEFPFPRALIGRVAQEVLGAEIHAPGDDPYASESMTWAVLASLPAIFDEPGCQELRRYLTGEVRELKTFQLARRIAGVFDQYCLYRRELVLGWEAGEGADWQAVLFRAVRDRLGPDHQAGILERLLTRLGRTWSPGELPPRLSVFGISSLPPAYLQVLAGMGHHLDVHLYLLNPCAQYWADLTRADQIARRAEEADLTEAQAAEQLHLDEGHPLLASLGRQGQDMLRLLDRYAPDAQSVERFVDPLSAGADTALTRLQADILTLRDPNRDGPRPDLDSDNRSVSFHSCHAPTREVEVLHDQLRNLFESDPDLEPSDVLVMAPDIEAYAPLVEAVFGGGHDGGAPIPFGISDRRQRSEAQVISSFLLLLELAGGRLDIVQVFDLLAVEPVRARFGLGASEVELAEGWAREAGVRWGLDAAHREASGQPGLEENTWRFGLDRMLLGYAMPADERGLFAGRLAFDEIEGLEAATLGKLASFLQALDRAHRELGKPRRLGRWRDDLMATLASLVAEDGDNHHEHQLIRDALAELAQAADRVGFDQPVQPAVLLLSLRERLDERRTSLGFLSGGVTVCNLQPMRSLPFKVVCLLGMNDGVFPRVDRPLAFDKRSEQPQIGDRSSRIDDRYLFLEAVLAARQRLFVSFVGRSIADDSLLPPSVVVSELLDVMDPGTGGETWSPSTPSSPSTRVTSAPHPGTGTWSATAAYGARRPRLPRAPARRLPSSWRGPCRAQGRSASPSGWTI